MSETKTRKLEDLIEQYESKHKQDMQSLGVQLAVEAAKRSKFCDEQSRRARDFYGIPSADKDYSYLLNKTK